MRRAAAGLLAMAACADVPASPTYADDVRPILLANCVRCHREPEACTPFDRQGYRLDHWGDTGEVRGVASMTERITVRAVELADMPPTGPLAERELEVLRRWQRAGSPRGDAAAGDPPELALAGPIEVGDDERVHLAYDVRDPDGDAVSWSVVWRRAGVEAALAGPLGRGRGEVELDLGVLASGTYQLVAVLRGELDDEATEVMLGSPVELPARDAAPSVRLLGPAGGGTVARDATLVVTWAADDVDTPGALTAELRLVDDAGAVTELARGVDARAGSEEVALGGVAPGAYRVEIVVTDGHGARSDRSGCPFTVAP